MLLTDEHLEPLSKKVSVIVSKEHRFNTDTILLANFSLPRPGEVCTDLGTGCGAIPLIWCARSNPQKVYALELQEEAVSMARRSVEHNGLDEKISVICGDINTVNHLNSPRGLDLVACNPPYKPQGTGFQNPDAPLCIARHEVACRFSAVADAAARLLRFGGRFCCCLRPERLCDVIIELRRAGLEPKRLRFVQQRLNKEPSLFLLQAVRGGKPGLRVESAFLIENSSGEWSEEMCAVYGDYKDGHIYKSPK